MTPFDKLRDYSIIFPERAKRVEGSSLWFRYSNFKRLLPAYRTADSLATGTRSCYALPSAHLVLQEPFHRGAGRRTGLSNRPV